MSASTASNRKPATDLSALSTKLIEEVKKAFPSIELTQKKAYVRAHLGRTTVGYLYPSPNGGKSAVETPLPDASGKYAYQRISAVPQREVEAAQLALADLTAERGRGRPRRCR